MNILLGGKKCVKFLLRYTIACIVRIFFSFLLILNIPIAILLILLSPFFKIKIGELEMRAIGHSSISMEIFLSELENKIHDNSDDIYIWFVNDGYFPFERKKISNKFLYEKWKEKITIGPRYIFEPLFYIFRFLRKINIGNKFLIPYRHWKDHKNTKPWNIVDINNVLIKTLPQINFSDEEEKNGQKYLKKYDDSKSCLPPPKLFLANSSFRLPRTCTFILGCAIGFSKKSRLTRGSPLRILNLMIFFKMSFISVLQKPYIAAFNFTFNRTFSFFVCNMSFLMF